MEGHLKLGLQAFYLYNRIIQPIKFHKIGKKYLFYWNYWKQIQKNVIITKNCKFENLNTENNSFFIIFFYSGLQAWG